MWCYWYFSRAVTTLSYQKPHSGGPVSSLQLTGCKTGPELHCRLRQLSPATSAHCASKYGLHLWNPSCTVCPDFWKIVPLSEHWYPTWVENIWFPEVGAMQKADHPKAKMLLQCFVLSGDQENFWEMMRWQVVDAVFQLSRLMLRLILWSSQYPHFIIRKQSGWLSICLEFHFS